MRRGERMVRGRLGSSFILSPATTPCCVRDKRLHNPTESPSNIGPQDWSRSTLKGPLNALADSIHKLQCLNDTQRRLAERSFSRGLRPANLLHRQSSRSICYWVFCVRTKHCSSSSLHCLIRHGHSARVFSLRFHRRK